jgi:hypothetical protein
VDLIETLGFLFLVFPDKFLKSEEPYWSSIMLWIIKCKKFNFSLVCHKVKSSIFCFSELFEPNWLCLLHMSSTSDGFFFLCWAPGNLEFSRNVITFWLKIGLPGMELGFFRSEQFVLRGPHELVESNQLVYDCDLNFNWQGFREWSAATVKASIGCECINNI